MDVGIVFFLKSTTIKAVRVFCRDGFVNYLLQVNRDRQTETDRETHGLSRGRPNCEAWAKASPRWRSQAYRMAKHTVPHSFSRSRSGPRPGTPRWLGFAQRVKYIKNLAVFHKVKRIYIYFRSAHRALVSQTRRLSLRPTVRLYIVHLCSTGGEGIPPLPPSRTSAT